MNRTIRGAAIIGLWLAVGATVIVIVCGMFEIFSARSGWVLGVGIVVATGCAVLLAVRTDGAKPLAPVTGRDILASPPLAIGAGVVGAVLSLLVVLGGPARGVPTIAEIPGRISGQVQGMWASALLEQDLAQLRAHLGDRALQNLYLFGSHYTVDAYALTSDVGVDSFTLRNGELDLSDKREGWSTKTSFMMGDVDPAVIREVSDRIYATDPAAQITLMYLDAEGGLTIHVSIDGEYTSTSRVFDGRTGEERTEGEK